MSVASTSAAGWFTRRTPAPRFELAARPDDPRLGTFIERWHDPLSGFRPGRPVLLGFPQDEGVRRNSGRVGAAAGPDHIRHWLHRLTPWDSAHEADLGALAPLDLGNLIVDADLEASQALLGQVVAGLLRAGTIPIVLGGGHEAAFGHYLGYVEAGVPVGIINIDAHLDVRPLLDGRGHSGSPFRQALEHSVPLPAGRYACLGVQPFSTSREHLRYCLDRQATVRWRDDVAGRLEESFLDCLAEQRRQGCKTYLTIDADAVQAAEVPGVSAPNPLGLAGREVARCAFAAGSGAEVASLDVVEINPAHDPEGHSARWAALVIWHFLAGLALRRSPHPPAPSPTQGRGGEKSAKQ
jgi:formiminoglutamase